MQLINGCFSGTVLGIVMHSDVGMIGERMLISQAHRLQQCELCIMIYHDRGLHVVFYDNIIVSCSCFIVFMMMGFLCRTHRGINTLVNFGSFY